MKAASKDEEYLIECMNPRSVDRKEFTAALPANVEGV